MLYFSYLHRHRQLICTNFGLHVGSHGYGAKSYHNRLRELDSVSGRILALTACDVNVFVSFFSVLRALVLCAYCTRVCYRSFMSKIDDYNDCFYICRVYGE